MFGCHFTTYPIMRRHAAISAMSTSCDFVIATITLSPELNQAHPAFDITIGGFIVLNAVMLGSALGALDVALGKWFKGRATLSRSQG